VLRIHLLSVSALISAKCRRIAERARVARIGGELLRVRDGLLEVAHGVVVLLRELVCCVIT
jgi:hypothetical protein